MMIDISWLWLIVPLSAMGGGLGGMIAISLSAARRLDDRDRRIAYLEEQNARLRRGR